MTCRASVPWRAISLQNRPGRGHPGSGYACAWQVSVKSLYPVPSHPLEQSTFSMISMSPFPVRHSTCLGRSLSSQSSRVWLGRPLCHEAILNDG